MSVVRSAVNFMINIANDDTHGYDQQYRWGQYGDYDCSSLVITAYSQAGVPVKENGATYTGNMRNSFLNSGFTDVTQQVNLDTGIGLKAGDVLLNEKNHTAMYIGDNLECEASINEFGGVTGGKRGDQTGTEILVRTYRNYPWDCVLRYNEESETVFMFSVEQIERGDSGVDVLLLQEILTARRYYLGGLTWTFDRELEQAVREYQKDENLRVDGVCGNQTWSSLLGK